MRLLKLFCVAVVLYLAVLHNAYGRSLIIAISPYLNPAETKQQNIALLQNLTQLQPGDKAIVLDGYNLTHIGDFTIPDNPTYKSAKARLNVNRDAVGALMRFAQDSVVPSTEGHPSVSGAVRLPQLLSHIAKNYTQGEKLNVIVLGSPFYDDPREPAFSMADGRFPSDGHLFVSQSKTPFGNPHHSQLLANLHVHIGYGSEAIMRSDQHRFHVQRFWTLYIEQHGGKLVSFEVDLSTLFRRVNQNAVPLPHDHVPLHSDKLEMIRLRPQEIKQSIHDRALSKSAVSQSQIRMANNVEIGISWKCQYDLDLYARPIPNAQVLYFGETNSEYGQYWKDYREAPSAANGFETISFKVPLDLRVLLIAINFYEGDAPQGVSGEIRLSVDGHVYASTFQIKATKGNQGKDIVTTVNSGRSTAHSILINPLHIVGLK
ncbi:MAG: hypothetical protein ABTQ25_02125 [Nitrosomonas ureae]